MRKINPFSRFNPSWDDSCWFWTGPISDIGYGACRGSVAHKIIWEKVFGPVPSGKELHHICRNKACVRTSHLVLLLKGHHPDSLPAINSLKTHCPFGHPLSGSNLFIKKRIRGMKWHISRQCRRCDAIRSNRRYHERSRSETGTII